MELVKEQKDLIEKLVKVNPKFSGNEDLLEDFCSETYQKSYLILQSIEDKKSLNAYLKKVVSSAIMDVLKNSGRLTRSTKGYNNIKEINISPEYKKKRENADILNADVDEITDNHDVNELNLEETNLYESEDYNNDNRHLSINVPPSILIDLSNIKDPKESIEEQIIRKDIIENIINMVKQIDAEQPQEKYLKIFYLRYFRNKKQKDIAQETGISQSEISKRLVKLSNRIKEKLY